MTDSIVSITVDTGQADRKLRALPEVLRGRLRTVIVRDTKDLAALVRSNLSGAVLNTRSGRLLNSLKNEMVENAASVYGRVYSQGVPYAGIQERGGQTKPHEIRPINVRALHFFMGGSEVFATVVHHPGSKIPARPAFQGALDAMRSRLIADMTDASKGLWAA